jgi:hypothetical protein
MNNPLKKRPLAMLCTITAKNRNPRSRGQTDPCKWRDPITEQQPDLGGNRLSENSSTLLRRRTEEELAGGVAVSEKQALEQWSPAGLGLVAESRKVTRRFLPCQGAFRAAYATQIVKPGQHGMSTPKPTQNHPQPPGHQPRGHHTFRIHPKHCSPETKAYKP